MARGLRLCSRPLSLSLSLCSPLLISPISSLLSTPCFQTELHTPAHIEQTSES